VNLKDCVDVQAGHPFRGSVPFVEGGNACVLQMRDMQPDGSVAWTRLLRTKVDAAKAVQWLAPGDVVFAARGARNYAVCLSDVAQPTVCAPHFFLLRVKSQRLLPEFLAWQINRPPAQRYLLSNAEGTDQRSIRRPVLEALPLAVPPLPEQRAIVALAEAAVQEERQLHALIQNRQRQLDALALAMPVNH
jgi:hypothetical protein